MRQKMINCPIELGSAVSALFAELTHGVPFNNPFLKPNSLSHFSNISITPMKRSLTCKAEPALLPVSVMTIFLDQDAVTVGTMFFLPYYPSLKPFEFESEYTATLQQK